MVKIDKVAVEPGGVTITFRSRNNTVMNRFYPDVDELGAYMVHGRYIEERDRRAEARRVQKERIRTKRWKQREIVKMVPWFGGVWVHFHDLTGNLRSKSYYGVDELGAYAAHHKYCDTIDTERMKEQTS